MLNYTLGTIEASEALIKDLYIDLRAKVNAWSKITQQTPQARMGYVGQHLVSVVTGYPGGKSGARGYDLVIDDERHGEIKTCYRVDQNRFEKSRYTTIVTLTVYRFKIIIIASSVYMLIVLTTFRNTLVLFQIQYNYACY